MTLAWKAVNWNRTQNEFGFVETKEGAYVVRRQAKLWNWGRSISEFSDAVIEFDITIVLAPSNNNAGSWCHLPNADPGRQFN